MGELHWVIFFVEWLLVSSKWLHQCGTCSIHGLVDTQSPLSLGQWKAWQWQWLYCLTELLWMFGEAIFLYFVVHLLGLNHCWGFHRNGKLDQCNGESTTLCQCLKSEKSGSVFRVHHIQFVAVRKLLHFNRVQFPYFSTVAEYFFLRSNGTHSHMFNSYILVNNVSVNDNLHIQWSHMIITELKDSYFLVTL